MKHEEDYAKAFEVLTQRLKDATQDRHAYLAIAITDKLYYSVIYFCHGNYRYFYDSAGRSLIGDSTIDACTTHSLHAGFYSLSNIMNGFTKNDFMKIWLDKALGNDLCFGHYTDAKILDSCDTIELLCVQYDMAHT